MPTISIYRAERFSPNSIDRDKAIMDAVADIKHCDLRIREEEIARHTDDIVHAGLILSMARGSEALAILQSAERSTIVVNSATSLVNCSRSRIESLMRDNNIPAAPLDGNAGWWIKRGDGSYAIIDFNDWPSFSACRREAAEAIAGLTNKLKEERNGYIQADAAGINEI